MPSKALKTLEVETNSPSLILTLRVVETKDRESRDGKLESQKRKIPCSLFRKML